MTGSDWSTASAFRPNFFSGSDIDDMLSVEIYCSSGLGVDSYILLDNFVFTQTQDIT
jgi:hypothetical protein